MVWDLVVEGPTSGTTSGPAPQNTLSIHLWPGVTHFDFRAAAEYLFHVPQSVVLTAACVDVSFFGAPLVHSSSPSVFGRTSCL